MDKSVLIFASVITFVWALTLIATNPFTIAICSIATLFYLVQIIDRITYNLHTVNPVFPPLNLCYVCGSIAGTWAITGLMLGLLPYTHILFLFGMSLFAILNQLDKVVAMSVRIHAASAITLFTVVTFVMYPVIETYIGVPYGYTIYISGLFVKAITTIIVGLLQASDTNNNYTYRGYEENFFMYSLTIIGLAVITAV